MRAEEALELIERRSRGGVCIRLWNILLPNTLVRGIPVAAALQLGIERGIEGRIQPTPRREKAPPEDERAHLLEPGQPQSRGNEHG